MKKTTIAIDGYSSCGKSTIAKEIANALEYNYIDTGAMYRAVTYYFMREGILKDAVFLKQQVIDALKEITISFKLNSKKTGSDVYLNNVNIEHEIRNMAVSKRVSQISAIHEVRTKLVKMQQKLGKTGGIVMDGRDIGTVVFPHAEVKLFITADVDIRTERRLKEMQIENPKISFNEVRNNLTQRDHLDMTRDISPLKQAEDAIVIDNSYLTKDEQLEKVMDIIKKRIA